MTKEEALKIIKDNCTDSRLREACEMFIPELQETYKEKTIKAIIKAIKSSTKALCSLEDDGYNVSQTFCWLESLIDVEEYNLIKEAYKSCTSGNFKAGKKEVDRKINFICDLIKHNVPEGNYIYGRETVSKQGAIEMLKSIKGHNNWKPTEEQMAALSIVKTAVNDERGREVLDSLYTDLKKITGEP